jgi:hypothetical protein
LAVVAKDSSTPAVDDHDIGTVAGRQALKDGRRELVAVPRPIARDDDPHARVLAGQQARLRLAGGRLRTDAGRGPRPRSDGRVFFDGIRTCLEFARADRQLIRRLLTVVGEAIW